MRDKQQILDDFLTINEAAQLVGISHWTVRSWLRKGLLTRYKSVSRTVASRKELLALLKPRKVTKKMISTDAIDELVARSKDHRELRAFHEFHKRHPEVLDFLVQEIQLRIEHGFKAFSYHSLWHYARWKLEMDMGPGDTFLMNDHHASFYSRAITVLHPEFNGRAEFREALADELFGLEIEPSPDKRPKNYARRLQWADGTAIEDGWRPSTPHTVNHLVNRKPDIHGKGE